ncbi:MAG: DUF58 domain-containing protein [Bifidobacterium mongoliense]|jgi:uncharacterized protein (DUF58 family)|uniref:DUF58 domain-containing protein n=1 Tax=Bifidobacterium mongoliense TaxID=518643 RepID=UPI00264895FD|nr:DUF58 domain-containing protein [Bifidobacterium mongoliense]MDN5979905.1 DUF58 domain-containing protein [Bifidobacterium mongoliense]MDN6782760.1 DUF58 domain-containing protein [Bifidobacterium mongoliense]MDN6802890.1 DUF58 domain-containing protein [Bifidobacterium mongoliense]
MIDDMLPSDRIRRRIEALGTSISLPTVRRALGALEGEHASTRRFGSDDAMDIRAYEAGDEARLIDWKSSARTGRTMVVQRQRLVTSRVWMLLDVGREMRGVCPSGEAAYEVAANALCMFAALSLRRSDDVSLVFGNAASIVRIPFHGGLAHFERTLDTALRHGWDTPRNIDALLEYARRIGERHALIILATDEHALTERHLHTIRTIAQTHPLVIVDVATLNPFVPGNANHAADGVSGRRVPAFLKTEQTAREVSTHREFTAAALQRELHTSGSRLIRSASSEAMFTRFVRLVAASSGQAHLGARTPVSAWGGEAR